MPLRKSPFYDVVMENERRGIVSEQNEFEGAQKGLFIANLIVAIISVLIALVLVIPVISFGLSLLGMFLSSRVSNWDSHKRNTIRIVFASICLGLAVLVLLSTPLIILFAMEIGYSENAREHSEWESPLKRPVLRCRRPRMQFL